MRYTARALPPYCFVPGGGRPHPTESPAGYLHDQHPTPEPLHPPERWREQGDYLFGVDLFNLGYYWEAHEAWEGLWRQAGGEQRAFLQGLIQLAGAMLKRRTGAVRGEAKLRDRAARRLAVVHRPEGRYMGVDVAALLTDAKGPTPPVIELAD